MLGLEYLIEEYLAVWIVYDCLIGVDNFVESFEEGIGELGSAMGTV